MTVDSIRVFRSLGEIPAEFGPSAVAVGNFDGVHRGHHEVLSAIAAEARINGWRSIAITFDPHPECFLRPDRAPKLLAPIPERLRLMAQTGIDAVLVLSFDRELSLMRAREFVQTILVERLQIRSIHEGANFRFGHCAEAGVVELAEFGQEFGFSLTVHQAVVSHGLTVSSSAIRERIAAGDIRRARWMLGHTFAIRSTPARGRGIGTKLLVPTVNLAPYPELLPAKGVYVARLTVFASADAESGRCFQAVTNVGDRPTFGEPSFSVESHLLDFEPVELTEETPLELEFLYRLRPELTWPSPEALKAQIMKDVAKAKRFHRLAQVESSRNSMQV
ncbi:riboflavin biosynthesis protein RibF [Acidicapsa dinghuensis]|uniref:Riboflavin biosynthesis protein n=1 Tax=Acidicapsa dinghuensis TaxID=2218256 RepID=A0ABW1EDA0_9BACT|nr:riboflavin biosynthesis protein RibF [Acidicapsa dinghuensis]